MLLAREPDRSLTVGEVASGLSVSANHLAKVMQRLVRVGLVSSTRGPGGGFRLGKPACDITLLEIVETMDGPVSEGFCLLGNTSCPAGQCLMGPVLASIHDQVRRHLRETRLSDTCGSAEDRGNVVSPSTTDE